MITLLELSAIAVAATRIVPSNARLKIISIFMTTPQKLHITQFPVSDYCSQPYTACGTKIGREGFPTFCSTSGGSPSLLLLSITQVPVKLILAAAKTKLRFNANIVAVITVAKVPFFIVTLLGKLFTASSCYKKRAQALFITRYSTGSRDHIAAVGGRLNV
jgi:hypothetical protein